MSLLTRPSIEAGFLLALLIIAGFPGRAAADALRAFLEWDYSTADFTTTDNKSGLKTESTFDTFTQKYNLYFDRTIFPYLRIDGGGIFTRDINTGDTGGAESGSTENDSTYFFNIMLKNPVYLAAVGYNKREELQKFTGVSPSSVYNESYTAALGWKPGGLPELDANYTHSNIHDGRRLLRDDISDLVVFTARYDPLKNLKLDYSFNYNDLMNNITKMDTTIMTHTGKISYSDTFFNKRLSVSSDYTITSQETTISANMGGSVEFQVFPTAGLSAVAGLTVPELLTGTLTDAPFLIDGATTQQTLINIGLAPTQADDTRFRSMGLDFFNPVEISELFIFTDPDLSKILNPANIPLNAQFVWHVFTSPDNQNWTEVFGVSQEYGPFVPRFKLTFPKVKARFFKVAVQPLPLTVLGQGYKQAEVANIFVTELQAFDTRTARSIPTTVTSQILNLNARAKLLEKQGLNYEFSLFLNRVDPAAVTTAFMSNGLSFSRKFGETFTANARVAREDNFLQEGHADAYVYTGSVTARPYATLTDSLIYSGRRASSPTGHSGSDSVFLYNNAELYKGINALLNGGISFTTAENGQSTQTESGNIGLTLVPHRTMNINLNYNVSDTSISGGDRPSSSVFSGRATAGVGYTPFRALYLFASVEALTDNISTRTSENYGLNFSPFPDGALQLNFAYNESLRPGTEGKSRLISPSLRWNIWSGAYLEASYVHQQTKAPQQTAKSNIFSAMFRMTL